MRSRPLPPTSEMAAPPSPVTSRRIFWWAYTADSLPQERYGSYGAVWRSLDARLAEHAAALLYLDAQMNDGR